MYELAWLLGAPTRRPRVRRQTRISQARGSESGQIRGVRAPVTPCGAGMWRWSVSSVGVERGGCAGYRVEGGLGVDRQAGQAVQVSGQQRAVLVSQPMTSARLPPADDPGAPARQVPDRRC